MKLKITAFLMLAVVSIYSRNAFVTARMCAVHSAADSAADKVGILRQAAEVTVISESGEWLKVRSGTIEGFVNARFIGDEPAVVLESIADGRKDMANVEVRKRASTYTSSAAAIRGLSTEDVKERENVSFTDYDFNSIKWIEENFSYTADEIIEFSLGELN